MRAPRTGARDTGEALGCATVPLAACTHTAREPRTIVRTSIDSALSIDRYKKKPAPAAGRRSHTHKAERKLFLPVRFVCSYVRLVSFFRTIVDLIFVLDDAEPPQSGSQPLQVASRRLPLERMRLNKAAELATAKPMEE